MHQKVRVFDNALLELIRNERNEEAKLLLNKDIAQKFDYWGSLLHRAAAWGNHAIVEELLNLGAEVDKLGDGNRTPLFMAVLSRSAATVTTLLDYSANIDIVSDYQSMSPVQRVFSASYSQMEIIEAFVNKMKKDTPQVGELAERLIRAGGNMFHGGVTRDIILTQILLERKVPIDSRGADQKTALHVAAKFNDYNLACWLIRNRANINATDKFNKTSLLIACSHGNFKVVKLLLKNKADPNIEESTNGQTPLFACIFHSGVDKLLVYTKCVELLIEYRANPKNASDDTRTILDWAMDNGGIEQINTIIAGLALREMRSGEPVNSTVLMFNDPTYYEQLQQLIEQYFNFCVNELRTEITDGVTLNHLLIASDVELKRHAQNAAIAALTEKITPQLETNCFYRKLLKRRMAKAARWILEDQAVLSLNLLFQGTGDEFYLATKKIVRYLQNEDLCRLNESVTC